MAAVAQGNAATISSPSARPIAALSDTALPEATSPLLTTTSISTEIAPAQSISSPAPLAASQPINQVADVNSNEPFREILPSADRRQIEKFTLTQNETVSTAESVESSVLASEQAVAKTAQATIHLQINNVRPDRGSIKVAIFTAADNFPNKDAAAQTLELDDSASTATAQLSIEHPCAIAVFQDIDGSGDLTRNRLGIPVEPCGFSNNARINRGPPSFGDAVVPPGDGFSKQPTFVQIDLP